jgi:ABC-type uncharacterized transport system substrate-binding protein
MRAALAVALLLVSSAADAAQLGVVLDAKTPYYEKVASIFEQKVHEARPDVAVAVCWAGANQMARRNTLRRFMQTGFDGIIAFGRGVCELAVDENEDTPLVLCGGQLSAPTTSKDVVDLTWRLPPEALITRLRQFKPITTLAVAYATPGAELDAAVAAAEAAGLTPTKVDVSKDVAGLAGAQAVLFASCGCTEELTRAPAVAQAAKALKIPLATTFPGGELTGALLSMYVDGPWMAAQAAQAAVRMVAGDKKGIPRPVSPKISFILNTSTAIALGLRTSGPVTDGLLLVSQ